MSSESEGRFGYCGINCSECPVFIATQKNDNSERERVAKLFTEQYGEVYEVGDINCRGCLTESEEIFKYCKICPIRKCARERKVKSCVFCSVYPCEELLKLFKGYPKAKENLETLRRKRNIT